MTVFDAERWWCRVAEELNAFRGLQCLSEDADALDYHLDRFKAEGADAEFLALTDEEKSAADAATFLTGEPTEHEESAEDKLRIRVALSQHLSTAFATYRRQTLVVAVTYLEIMTEDFLRAVFVSKPHMMYEYMNQWAEQKGKVDLKDVIEAESKELLIKSLALKSARLAGQGKFRVVISNIKRITHRELGQDLIRRLEDLIERRNQLVHEDNLTEVNAIEAEEALLAVMDFSEELGRIASAVGISVKTIPDYDFSPIEYDEFIDFDDASDER